MKISKAILFVLAVTLSLTPLLAQKNTPMPQEKFRLGLTYYHPSFESEDDFSALSGIYELHGEVSVSEKFSLFGVLPYSAYSMNDESADGFGNILLGAKIGMSDDKSLAFRFGVALPTISDDDDVQSANYLSAIGKFYELLLFAPDRLTIFGDIEKRFNFVGGFYASALGGLAAFIPTGDNEGAETELLIPFKLGFGYEKPEMVGISAHLVGIYHITADSDETGDQLFHVLRFEIKYPGATFEPAFRFELPMNEDYSDNVEYLIGIQLLFKFL